MVCTGRCAVKRRGGPGAVVGDTFPAAAFYASTSARAHLRQHRTAQSSRRLYLSRHGVINFLKQFRAAATAHCGGHDRPVDCCFGGVGLEECLVLSWGNARAGDDLPTIASVARCRACDLAECRDAWWFCTR